MDARIAKAKTIEWVREHSGIEQHRRYLGMSQIGRCPRLQYTWFVDGKGEPSDKQHLNCISGYMIEFKMLEILKGAQICRDGACELVAPFGDGRFRGHVDGVTVDGQLIEIKSFNYDDYNRVTRTGKIPVEYVWQVQAYLRYGLFRSALLVLVCRDPFTYWMQEMKRDDQLGAQIEARSKMILRAIDERRAPACECGRC